MLRIQRYKSEYLDRLRVAFEDIFHSSENQYFDILTFADLSFIGVDRNGDIKAFIIVTHTPDKIASCEISYVGVCSRYRQKGYGSRLIELVKDAAGKKGVLLNVLESDTKGSVLYQRLGFEQNSDFTSENGHKGVVFVCGVCCWQCDKPISGKNIYLEKHPTTLNFANGTFVQQYETIRVCRQCRTKVEP
jgi:GNAT superfamily N-acetyltransferase